jgi:uncharacterized membrane protein YoaK (UPF0700 family)
MVVHSLERLTTFRNLASWALLAFGAGAVNLGALRACDRFVAHVTGTLTRVGADAADVLGLDYLLVVLSFMVGAGAAVVSVRKLARDRRMLPYWIPLAGVSILLLVVACLGSLGVFGPFGGTVETAGDFALLCLLSFAMGLQNATVAVSTGMAVRTTHMTGPATDAAVAAATLLVGSSEERTKAWASLQLRGTKLIAFMVGAAVMLPICGRVGFLAFVVPSIACAVATTLSYAPQRLEATFAAEGGSRSGLKTAPTVPPAHWLD